MEKVTAIVLAARAGKRMNSTVQKQYMLLADRPVIFYALDAFEKSAVTDVVLVVGAGEVDYCRREVVEKYGFKKVRAVVEGGKERYHSVAAGLNAAEGAEYVLIHDGARPFVTQEMIQHSIETAKRDDACVVGMPVKDTIKIVGADGFVQETPDRRGLWQIQTPQSFSYSLIADAYQKVVTEGECAVTDDAMVLEQATGRKVRVIEGSYRNIKITTPEDLLIAEAYLKELEKSCKKD